MSNTDTSLALANMGMCTITMPIKAVEKETGISKELLRMWERRYGFPSPSRDSNNDRMYPSEQVERLRIIRRLLDSGFRPGKIIHLSADNLKSLISDSPTGYISNGKLPKNLQKELLNVVKSRNLIAIHQYLNHQLIKIGLEEFVLNLMQHANTFVGDAWMRGDIGEIEENLYTQQISSLLKNAIANLADCAPKPKVMITTPPNESHTLGVLMIEALLKLDGIQTITCGNELTIPKIAKSAARSEADIVLINFSGTFATNRAIDFLEKLRLNIPIKTEVWAGGSSLQHTRKKVDSVIILDELNDIRNRILFWQRQHGLLRQ